MSKLCPMNKEIGSGEFKKCIEANCAWYDDETGECEITNLSLISKIPTEQRLMRNCTKIEKPCKNRRP